MVLTVVPKVVLKSRFCFSPKNEVLGPLTIFPWPHSPCEYFPLVFNTPNRHTGNKNVFPIIPIIPVTGNKSICPVLNSLSWAC